MWPRHLLVTLSILSLAIAGCGDKDARPAELPPTPTTVSGWILDHEIRPVAGATLTTGEHTATSDENGQYTLTNLTVGSVTIVVKAEGLRLASKTIVLDREGQTKSLNFSLIPAPTTTPYISVDKFDGYIECSAFATAGHNHGGSGPPEGENPTDCGRYTTTKNRWDEEIFPGLDGLVVETVWTPQNELAANLLMIVYQLHDNGTHEYLAFAEGRSPLKAHLPSLDVQDRFADGGWIHVIVEIGAGPDAEDVAAGAAIDQTFEGFTSQFFGMWPQDDYSVTA